MLGVRPENTFISPFYLYFAFDIWGICQAYEEIYVVGQDTQNIIQWASQGIALMIFERFIFMGSNVSNLQVEKGFCENTVALIKLENYPTILKKTVFCLSSSKER